MKDCTTCKHGFVDERLGFPMCHHPKRFSEDCVDFNMHEEKEEPEKATGVEEKKLPDELEKEIATWIPNHLKCEKNPDLKKALIKWAGFIARHFADWGAKHLRDFTKMMPEGLEEAAKNRVTENGRFPISEFEEMRIRDIKFGAEWQKAKMIEGAVEGEVSNVGYPTTIQLRTFDSNFMCGEKVRIIIVKEDEK